MPHYTFVKNIWSSFEYTLLFLKQLHFWAELQGPGCNFSLKVAFLFIISASVVTFVDFLASQLV